MSGVLLACSGGACAGDEPTQASGTGETATVLAEVRFQPDILVVVQATCLGKQRYFAFDTGATSTVIDNSLRDQLGDPTGTTKIRTATGVIQLQTFQAPHLSVGNFQLRGERAFCGDLRRVSELVGASFAGLIGLDSFDDFVVALNPAEGTIRFYDRLPDDLVKDAESFPLKRTRLGFAVLGRLPRMGEEAFLLDSGGAWSITLGSQVFEQLSAGGEIQDRFEIHVSGVGGERTTEDGRLQTFQLGRFKHEDLSVTKASDDVSTIGCSYLRRYVAVFDFPGRRLYLKPSKHFNDPEEPFDKSGLVPARRDDRTFIYLCRKNSPAREAGL